MADKDENRNEPGTFLTVEKTADGYIEQDRLGNKHQYVLLKDSCPLTIEKLYVQCTIDAQSGAKRMVIFGRTKEEIRAIGVTGDHPIFQVTILADGQPGKAMILKRYTLEGGSLDATMSINVAETAMSSMVDELRHSKTARVMSVAVKQGTFFTAYPDWENNVVLLPWLEEQRKTKTSDDVTVEFPLEIAALTVGPELGFGGHLLHEAERTQPVRASFSGPVGIYYSKSEHPLQSTLQETIAELSLLRSTLTTLVTAVAIGIVLLAVRFW